MRFFNYLKFIPINKKVIFYHKKNCKKLWQNQEKHISLQCKCGSSSVDRAIAFQAVGRGFEPRLPL